MALGTKQHSERAARLRREFQAPQPAIIAPLEPEQHRGADTRAQSLLGSPQGLSSRHGAHNEQAIESDAGLRQRRGIRLVRRSNPDEPGHIVPGHALLGLHESGQEQLHFA